jgi:glutamine synthetase
MISIGDGDELNPPANHAAYGMSSLIAVSDYGRDLVSALDVQGVAVEQFHPEFSAGQFEVSVSANDPLSAADTTALVRATIRAVGHQHGYRTSFAPKPDLDSLGNGGHLHLSLWRGSENLMIPHEGDLAPDAEAFAAGVLGRLQALAALGAPSPASYLRLTPKSWAGAYGCWGWENREAAIRMLSGRGSQNGCAANLEIKCFDQMANPYLLLAGVLAAGMHGIDNSLRLPEETRGDPATLSSEQRSAAGIVELPSNLDEATKAFANDEMLSSAFGPKLVDQIVMVRRHDADALRSRSAAEVAAATRWVG